MGIPKFLSDIIFEHDDEYQQIKKSILNNEDLTKGPLNKYTYIRRLNIYIESLLELDDLYLKGYDVNGENLDDGFNINVFLIYEKTNRMFTFKVKMENSDG